MKLKYKFMLVIVTVLLLSCLTIGSSYSLWLSNSTQLGENTMNIGCFNLTFEDSDSINLTNSFPIEHKVGSNLHPYTFTITNVCDYVASFNVNLELLSSTTLADSDIRVMLNNGGSSLYTEYEEAEGVLSGDGTSLSDTSTNTSRKITSGVLWPNKSRTYSLRLWIDEDATSSAMNKALHAKVVTVSTPFNENRCTYDGELVQGAEYTDSTYTYKYMQEATSSSWQNITEDGWGVKLSDTSATGEINTPICTSINGKPIVSTTYMYYNAKDLTSIDVSSFDTSNVVRMSYMFSNTGYNSSSFEIIGMDNFDMSNVKSISTMFSQAGYNATIFNIGDLSMWNTSSVTNMVNVFNWTAGQNATTFDIGNLSRWDTSSVTTMYRMFYCAGSNATTWSIGDLSNWDTSNTTRMDNMLTAAGGKAITFDIGNLSSWDVSKVTTMSNMFNSAGSNAQSWDIGDLSNWDTSSVENMSYMFDSAGYNATTFNIGDLSSWDTSNVANMSFMFEFAGQNATTFDIGDLSSWDISNVTNISFMFNAAGRNATTWSIGDLSSWDTSNVTNMQATFSEAGQNAQSWSIGNLSNWDVSNVSNMYSMFKSAGENAQSWSIGDLSSWDTSNVTNMSNMFNSAGSNATNWNSIGKLKTYANNLDSLFYNVHNAKVELYIYSQYVNLWANIFINAATEPGSLITVNYSSAISGYVDGMIATANGNPNVVKGVQLD